MATLGLAPLSQLPVPPEVPMSLREKLRVAKAFHTEAVTVRNAGGRVCAMSIGPRWLVPRFVVVASPSGAHDVLAATSQSIDKGADAHIQFRLLLGKSLFSMSNAEWKPRRRTLQPIFTKKHVATFARHMSVSADLLAADWLTAGRVDLDQDARRLTMRVLSRSVLGGDLGDRATGLGPDLNVVLSAVTQRVTSPVRSPFWLKTPARRRALRARDSIHAVLDDAVARTRRGESTDPELIQLLLDTRDPETGAGLTAEQVRDELFTFFLAGHDTTATTITYALWALGHRLDLQARVAEEARALGNHAATAADLPSLPYTAQVVHEALRLCPPAPLVVRLARSDIAVGDYRVPAGTNLVVSMYAMHRDPEIWGEDAEVFDPDRFSPHRSEGRDRWAFLPFGAGPRSCIGDHFAMLEATIALATLLRTVEVESLEDEFPLALPFTMTAGGPIPAVVRRREP